MDKVKKSIKPFIRIVAFTIVFLIVFYGLTFMSKPSDLRNSGRIYGLSAEKKDTIDVVYIGGSAAFVYYQPLYAWEKAGIVSYDYAAAGVQAELYKYMIEEVLKVQDPKLFVIDARAFQYRDAANDDSQPPSEFTYRTTLDGMRLSANKIDFINQYVGTTVEGEKLPYYLDLIKYHGHGFPDKDRIKIMLGTYKENYKGYFLEAKHKALVQKNFASDEKRELSEETYSILVDLLEYCSQKDCDFLFVVSPYLEKEEHKQTFNSVEQIVNSYHYQFLDLNEYTEEMGIDYATDFYDGKHVNVFGAEKYTDYLTDHIVKNFDIPDRRDDPDYSFMNDHLDDWHRDVLAGRETLNKIIEEDRHE